MNQQERSEQQIMLLSQAALWYAWGRIDAALHTDGFGVDEGIEFQRLYEEIAREYATGRRTFRQSITDAWRQFENSKRRDGLTTPVTVADIDSWRNAAQSQESE
jgi:hypothetical protein